MAIAFTKIPEALLVPGQYQEIGNCKRCKTRSYGRHYVGIGNSNSRKSCAGSER